jgi:hypothetical protein
MTTVTPELKDKILSRLIDDNVARSFFIPKRCQNNLKDKPILLVFNLYKLNIVSGLVL